MAQQQINAGRCTENEKRIQAYEKEQKAIFKKMKYEKVKAANKQKVLELFFKSEYFLTICELRNQMLQTIGIRTQGRGQEIIDRMKYEYSCMSIDEIPGIRLCDDAGYVFMSARIFEDEKIPI